MITRATVWGGSLPDNLTPLAHVFDHSYVNRVINVMGIVVDYRVPMRSRGGAGDYTATFKIVDSSCLDGVSARVFSQDESNIPAVTSLGRSGRNGTAGDIVFFFNMKAANFRGELVLLTTPSYSYILSKSPARLGGFSATVAYPKHLRLTNGYLAYMRNQRTWWASETGTAPPSAPPFIVAPSVMKFSGAGKQKFSLIRDVQPDCFYDFVGQVVKVFREYQNMTIYITDYTCHPKLFEYDLYKNDRVADGWSGKKTKWRGPLGRYTLQVTLWDKHAEAARDMVMEGQYISLSNVRIKENREGYIEGALHGDRKYPTRVDIGVIENINGEKVRGVRAREREYKRRLGEEPAQSEGSIKAIALKSLQHMSSSGTIDQRDTREFKGAVSSFSVPVATNSLGTTSGGEEKFSLICDARLGCFYDFVGQVVKVFWEYQNMTVYITDYTSHPKLFEYKNDRLADGWSGNKTKWRGPLGRYTLQVTLWDKHAEAARDMVMEGQYISLSNVRIKENREGYIEGALHGDRKYPTRVDIGVIENINDGRVRDVRVREREYQKRLEESTLPEELSIKPQSHMGHNEIESRKGSSDTGKAEDLSAPRIRCERPSQPITSIKDLIAPLPDGRPYVNRKYHIFCKVVDFLPLKLEDFSRLNIPNPDAAGGEDQNRLIRADSSGPKQEWVWRFAFLVEGKEGSTVRLIVEGKDAEDLFGFKAVDLRTDKESFNKLREKMRIVCGDLHQQKYPPLDPVRPSANAPPPTKQPKKNKRRRSKRKISPIASDTNKKQKTGDTSKPVDIQNQQYDVGQVAKEDLLEKWFDACVKEYGVPDSKGTVCRVWYLFGTRIQDPGTP